MVKNRALKRDARALKAETGTLHPRALDLVRKSANAIPFRIPFTGIMGGLGDGTDYFEPQRHSHLLLTGWADDVIKHLILSIPDDLDAPAWILDPGSAISEAEAEELSEVSDFYAQSPSAILQLLGVALDEVTERKQLLATHGAGRIKDLPPAVRPQPALLFIAGWDRLVESEEWPDYAARISKVIRDARAAGISLIISGRAIDTWAVEGGSILEATASRLHCGRASDTNPLLGFAREGWNDLRAHPDQAIFEPAFGVPKVLDIHDFYYDDGTPASERVISDWGPGTEIRVGAAGGSPVEFRHSLSGSMWVCGLTRETCDDQMLQLAEATPEGVRVLAITKQPALASRYGSLPRPVETVISEEQLSAALEEIIEQMTFLRESCDRYHDEGKVHPVGTPTAIFVGGLDSVPGGARGIDLLNRIVKLMGCTGVSVIIAAHPGTAAWKNESSPNGRATSGARMLIGPSTAKQRAAFFPPGAFPEDVGDSSCYWDTETCVVLDPIAAPALV